MDAAGKLGATAESQRRATDDGLAEQLSRLTRQYARRNHVDLDILESLRALTPSLDRAVAVGLCREAARADVPSRHLLIAQPELWWLDLEAGIHATLVMPELLAAAPLEQLRKGSLALVSTLDQGQRPAAWESTEHLFESLVAHDDDPGPAWHRARVLARGVGLSLLAFPGWVTDALRLVENRPSRDLLRALARDDRMLSQPRAIGALLLRGGRNGMALAAAALFFADRDLRIQVRDQLAAAPLSALNRVVGIAGLLSLTGDGGEAAADPLHTVVLTRAWIGAPIAELVRWPACFRGEHLAAQILGELGDQADAVARAASLGLAEHVGKDSANDPIRRDAIATCLAFVLDKDADVIAPVRLAEAKLRDLGRSHGDQAMAQAMRAFAVTLLAAIGRLGPKHPAAKSLYSHVLRLRRAHPDALPRALFPDSLARALAPPQGSTGLALPALDVLPDSPRWAAGPSPIEPLPAADELVASVEGILPLPNPTARWAGATGWSVTRLLGWALPLPFRHLGTRLAARFGLTPKARFLLSDDGRSAVVTRHRVLGRGVRTTRRAIPSGCLFTFPIGCEPADRLLGRWTALLMAGGTIGTWLLLGGAPTIDPILATLAGSGMALVSLLGYLGALGLRRIIGEGNAVAVIDDHDTLRVWAVTPETRALLAPGATEPPPPPNEPPGV